MFWVQLILAGIATGSIYALSGMGLVLTYKATGVFNFAYGAIAMLVAYVLYQMNQVWHIPLLIALPIAVIGVGPAIGLVLERVVFRPLERSGAATSEKLVAALGVFLLALGMVYAIWTGRVRKAPRVLPHHSVPMPSTLILGWDQLIEIFLVIAFSAGLWLLFRYTRIGTEIRAVVDRRELAELASINANRVAGVSWMLGCGLAGLTGILFSDTIGQLSPYQLTLVVIECFSIAVVARLVSLPIVVGAGIVLLGGGHALLSHVTPPVAPLFPWPV